MDEQPPAVPPSDGVLPPPPGSMEALTPAPRKRGRILIAAFVAFALVVAGGAAAAFMTMRGSGEVLFAKVPASSDVVFTVYLDPSAGQKANLFMLGSKFPALGSEQQLLSQFQGALDRALESSGIGHDDLAWVGDQVAFLVDVPASLDAGSAPALALLIDAKDEGAAKDALEKLRNSSGMSSGGPLTSSTIDGVDVTSNHDTAYAVFDGTVVVASSLDEMSTIVSTAHHHQAALEGSSGLQAATAGLPEGKLALLYVNPTDLIALAQQTPGFSQATPEGGLSTLQAITGLALTVSAQPDGIALDAQAILDPSKLSADQRAQMSQPDHPNPLLTSIPADALAVIAGAHLDTSLASTADQVAATSPQAAGMLRKLGVNELIAAINGDVVIEAAPDSSEVGPGATMILGAKDPAAMQDALDQLAKGLSSLAERSLTSSGGVMLIASNSHWITRDYQGVAVHTFQMASVPDISYAVIDDKGVIGTSAAQVEHVIDTAQGGPNITGAPAFKDAMADVPSSDGSAWVDIQGIVQVVRQLMSPEDKAAFDRDTMPNLAPLKALVVGSESDASHERVRVFLKID